VFEFLLVNHPLDCPVCDKGGECPLQDFSYQFGPDLSRMDFPRREFDGNGVKADVDFGPTLMLNRNRCILCTRCVRFMRDIDSDAQINIIDRGNGSQIATFQEEGVHSLLSGNLMDVCPVGAITTRDYRFKSRPWDNPFRRGHDLHAVRERVQRDRVDQGEAGVGEGIPADPLSRRASTPTSTTTGCATSGASNITGSKATTAWSKPLVRTGELAAAGVLARRDGEAPGSAGRGRAATKARGSASCSSAHASHESSSCSSG